MKPTLTILFEYPTLNGGEVSMLSVLPRLSARYSVVAAAPSSGPLNQALQKLDIALVPFDLQDSSGTRLPRPAIHQAITRVIEKTRPALAHANGLNLARMLGDWRSQNAFAGKMTGHLRDIIKLSKKAASDLNRLDRLAAVSQAVRESRLAQGMPPELVDVVHNGIDLSTFRPRAAQGWLHQELNLPSNALIIGSIGQIGMRKGVRYLVEAATQVVAREPRAAFVYLGDRHSEKDEAVEYERQLREATQSAPLKGRFFFPGRRHNIADLLPELCLFAHAALQEPLGRVLIEAAAAGLPIVATRVGGTAEIFPEPNQALLVPPKDANVLASAFLTLLADPVQRRSLANHARRRIESAFSVDRAADQLLAFWQTASQS